MRKGGKQQQQEEEEVEGRGQGGQHFGGDYNEEVEGG